ncbi:MAG: hypothetical protein WCP45_08845 [Verrucomicrobiota bacterium]
MSTKVHKRSSRYRYMLWALACWLSVSSLVQRATADTVGLPWTGQPGVTQSVTTLHVRERHGAMPETAPPRNMPVLRPDRHGLPGGAQTTHGQPGAPSVNLPNFGPQPVGTNYTGATLADCDSYPPDTMGAVGPTQFIVAVNGRLRSFNKATGVADGVLDLSMDTFFSPVMTPPISSNYTTDPHIRYDRLSGRWFLIIVDVPGGASKLPNRVLIAVSNAATITTSAAFTFFYFQHDTVSPAGDTGKFADYPTLGIDNNALYIGDNVFTSRGRFSGCSAFVVRKSSILGTGPIVVTAFRGLVTSSTSEGPYTPQGVDNFDPAATEGYFIGTSNAAFGRLVARRVSTPGGTPTLSSNILIAVDPTTDPITVPHLGNTSGTNGYLDAVDDRLFAAHIRNGQLWTAHNIEVDNTGTAAVGGGRNGSRWYQIQNLGGTPSVVQSGTVFDSAASNPKSYWIPSIMVSGQGHVAMGFSSAGSNSRINAACTGRLAGDPLGTMQIPSAYTASSTAYNPPADTGGPSGRRWGDFSFTSLDPDDDMTLWTIQEFCDSTDSYGLRVAKLSAPPPATPVSCSPSSILAGQAGVDVTVTGAKVSGSGFFDPGAGFVKRLVAAVSGGVAVTGVTYQSPTSLVLHLNTTAATLGAQSVTVTNPDGQASASATGILTLTSPLTPLQSWRQYYFGTTANAGNAADTADPNANGINNLLEYALGGDPVGNTTGTAILPQPGRSAGDTLQLGFARYLDRPDLTLTVQACDALVNPWTDLAQSVAGAPFVVLAAGATVTETGTGNTRHAMVTDPYQVTDPAHPGRFMRLRVMVVGTN